MSPYKLVTGSDKNLAAFETQINQALGNGYDLATDLVVHPISSAAGKTEFMLFQALVHGTVLNHGDDDEEFEDDEELDDDEFEDDEEFEDYDDEDEDE